MYVYIRSTRNTNLLCIHEMFIVFSSKTTEEKNILKKVGITLKL